MSGRLPPFPGTSGSRRTFGSWFRLPGRRSACPGPFHSPTGTAFLAPITPHTLTDVVVVPGDGRAPHKLELPAHVSGVKVPTAQLAPASLAGDGANGVYVTTYDANKRGAYVLHVHDGRADLVAASTASAASATCDVHKAVAARDFPCYFPTGIAYHSGHVYLAGNRSYVVDTGIGT